MMAHGAMVLAMASAFGMFSVKLMHAFAVHPTRGSTVDLVDTFALAWVALSAILHAVVGAAQLATGWEVRRYRHRTRALAALGVGVLTLVGVYCALTALPLAVWGAVVLFHRDVARRFAATAFASRSSP